MILNYARSGSKGDVTILFCGALSASPLPRRELQVCRAPWILIAIYSGAIVYGSCAVRSGSEGPLRMPGGDHPLLLRGPILKRDLRPVQALVLMVEQISP